MQVDEPAKNLNVRTFLIVSDLDHLGTIRDVLNEDVCGVLLHVANSETEMRRDARCPPALRERIFTFESLTRAPRAALAPHDWPLYERCIRAVLADSRVHFLATRTYFNSPLNNSAVIERIVVNSLLILLATKTRRFIASSTPHSVQAWVLARCCEEMGVRVHVLERTPINNRAWIYRGLDAQEVVSRPDAPATQEISAYTRAQVDEQIASKAGARDARGFYISRMDLSSVKGSNSNQWLSYRRELAHVLGGKLRTMPIRMLSSWLKRRLYLSYKALATEQLPDAPFVIYFMHYQPERSSLPEGLFHTQQLLALRQLAWTLPKGWKLLVREHPSMWLIPLDFTVRTADYFEQVAALPDTQLCSMDIDTFELIDRSSVVSTLTGSVGFQGLLRGKPAFVFGLPAYKDHPGCFNVSTSMELASAFERIQQPEFREQFSARALDSYLLWVDANSIVADSRDTDWLSVRTKNFTELYRQVLGGRFAL